MDVKKIKECVSNLKSYISKLEAALGEEEAEEVEEEETEDSDEYESEDESDDSEETEEEEKNSSGKPISALAMALKKRMGK